MHRLRGGRLHGGAHLMILQYPESSELTLAMRPVLHPLFQKLPDGISEFTFANLYLFRETHRYRVFLLPENLFIFCGQDDGHPFFMSPFGLPQPESLTKLFKEFCVMKCVSETQAAALAHMGYHISQDRDNFDYCYLRRDLAELAGRKFHKKRNLIKAFQSNYPYEGKPLLEEHKQDAVAVLESWREGRQDSGDYLAAKEGLERSEELQLCGAIYYAEQKPVAYSLGEELACGKSFVIHFEKAVAGYKGVWQFVNQAFASILPEQYETINREQDLGNEGMRKAKQSYKPAGYIKKYKASAPYGENRDHIFVRSRPKT